MAVADSDSGAGGNLFEVFKVCANYIVTIATGYSRHVGGTGAISQLQQTMTTKRSGVLPMPWLFYMERKAKKKKL